MKWKNLGQKNGRSKDAGCAVVFSKSSIAPVPVMVSVPSFSVAVTLAGVGEPICQVWALRVAVQSKPHKRVKIIFLIMVLFFD
jgi:hypothetical protein